MKLKVIVHPDFHTAFDRLKKSLVPAQTAYKIRKLWTQFKEESAAFESVRKDITTRFAERDPETLELIKGDRGELKFSESGMRAANEEIVSLLETEFVPVYRLKLEDLGDAKITAEDFAFLEPLFDD